MQNAGNLKQALDNLNRELARNVQELKQKEDLRRHLEGEDMQLENDIKLHKVQIDEKKREIQRIEQEITQETNKIKANKQVIEKTVQEVTRLRMEAQKDHATLAQNERDYSAEINKNGTKH